jgi:hypothetical protein
MAGWPAFSVGTGACHAAVTTARDGNRLGDGNAFVIGRFDSLTLRSSSTEADFLTFTLDRVGLCAQPSRQIFDRFAAG